MKPERFTTWTPIHDDTADDEIALIEQRARREEWSYAVQQAGGSTEIEPDQLERVANPRYGKPIRDASGELVIDRVKFWIMARGWAIRSTR